MITIVIRQITKDPYTGMIHFHDSRNTLRCTQPQHGNTRGIRDQVSVERDDIEGVSGQREAPNFRRASVQNVKQNALALLDSNRFAMTKHATIDRKELVTDLVAVWIAFGERSFHDSFPGLLESLVGGRRWQKILRHVSAAAESRLEFFQNKKDFAIVATWIVSRLNVDRSDLAAVLPCRKIGPSTIVRMIEAQTARFGCESNTPLAMSRNVRCPFLGGAVDIGRDYLAVPMQLLRRVGLIETIYRALAAFFKADQRSGELTVVGDGGKNLIGSDLNRGRLDAHYVVSISLGSSGEKMLWRK